MAQPPNILWIVTTQWRAQAFGYAGDPNARTPHLDRFAKEAANFEQAVTPHPFGPLARAAMFTGIPSPHNGVRRYYDPLPPTARTIAHAMAERGYGTAFFGKWHLSPRDPGAPLVGEAHARAVVKPEYRGGFEFWEGFESGFLLNHPWLHGTRLPEPTRFAGYQSDVLCGRAGLWLKAQSERQDRPWFCVVSLEPPHPPYGAPAGGIGRYDPAVLSLAANVPKGGSVEATAREELAGYYAHIEATDDAIGYLIRAVPRDRTIIAFTSVHGDMHGGHGLFRKGWPYEESIRVPLLVRVPSSLHGSEWKGRREELVSLLDLSGWTTRWADGDDVPVHEAAAQQISMPTVVELPHQCDRTWRGVRTRMRKLILTDQLASDGSVVSSPWLYFDLQSDPSEQANLADDPARRGEIGALLSLIKLDPTISATAGDTTVAE